MGIGGLFKAAFNPVSVLQFATGPAGWASFAMRTLGSQIAMNALQRFGQQLGFPPAAINAALQTISAASGQQNFRLQSIADTVGQLGRQFNLSPFQQAQLQRSAEFDVNKFIEQMNKAADDGKTISKLGAKGRGSLLQVLAEVMINAMNNKVDEMMGLAQKMDAVKHKQGQNDSVQINTQLQVATQEFSMMMNSTANMIKTIGEGLAGIARKG